MKGTSHPEAFLRRTDVLAMLGGSRGEETLLHRVQDSAPLGQFAASQRAKPRFHVTPAQAIPETTAAQPLVFALIRGRTKQGFPSVLWSIDR